MLHDFRNRLLENGPSGLISFPLSFVIVGGDFGATLRLRCDQFGLLNGG
jgi:hypothetical protein